MHSLYILKKIDHQKLSIINYRYKPFAFLISYIVLCKRNVKKECRNQKIFEKIKFGKTRSDWLINASLA